MHQRLKEATELGSPAFISLAAAELATVEDLRGRSSDAVRWAQAAVKSAASLDDDAKATASSSLCTALGGAGHVDQAQEHCRSAIGIRISQGPSAEGVKALQAYGSALKAGGRGEQAIAQFLRAKELAQRLDDEAGAAYSLAMAADAALPSGRISDAGRWATEAAAAGRRLGKPVVDGIASMVLAVVHSRKGDLRAALVAGERAVRLLGGRRGVIAANARYTLGGVQTELGRHEAARATLQRALDDFPETPGTTRAELLVMLATVAVSRERFDEAAHLAQLAMEMYRAIGEEAGVGEAMTILGTVRSHLAGPAAGAELIRTGAEKAARTVDPVVAVQALLSSGEVAMHRGDATDAAAIFEQALERAKTIGSHGLHARAVMALSGAQFLMGRYEAGLRTSELLNSLPEEVRRGSLYPKIEIFSAVTDVFLNRIDRAIPKLVELTQWAEKNGRKGVLSLAWEQLNRCYLAIGDYPRAVKAAWRAVETGKESGLAKRHVNGLFGLGFTYHRLGSLERAERYYVEALQEAKRIQAGETQSKVLLQLGRLNDEQGETQAAIRHYRANAELHEAGGRAANLAHAYVGDALLLSGQVREAIAEYKRADSGPVRYGWTALAVGDGAKAVRVLDSALRSTKPMLSENRLSAQVGLGLARELQGDWAGATRAFEGAIDTVEEQREALQPADRATFYAGRAMLARRSDAYEGLVRVRVSAHDAPTALRTSEFLKARMLAEAIAARSGGPAATVSSTLRRRERGLRQTISKLGQRLPKLAASPDGSEAAKVRQELTTARAKLDRLVDELWRKVPAYAAATYPRPVSAKNVKVAKGEALIAFEVTGTATFAFVITRSGLEAVHIPVGRARLKEMVERFRSGFVAIRSQRDLARFEGHLGKRLFDLVLREPLNRAGEVDSLVIVPDEHLALLPFGALPTRLAPGAGMRNTRRGPVPTGVRYVADDFRVQYAHSATSFAMHRALARSGSSGKRHLVVADPVFSSNDGRLGGTSARTSDAGKRLVGAISDWSTMGVLTARRRKEHGREGTDASSLFPRLAETGRLAQRLKGLFGKKVQLLVGSDAREGVLLRQKLRGYRSITFATHGILDGTMPFIRQPALVLGQVDQDPDMDGFLTLSEVMGLDLAARIVVLTACQTGVGRTVQGEGVMGMGRAFQHAGARSVLMTLWPVAEDSTTLLTERFYKHLSDDRNPPDALAAARVDVRASGFEHPFHWGGFVLVGD